MTARDIETLDFLDALAADPSVSKTLSRQAVILAINAAPPRPHRGRHLHGRIPPHLHHHRDRSRRGHLITTGRLT